MSQEPPKHLVPGAQIEAEILTSQPPYIWSTQSSFRHCHSAHRCVKTPKLSRYIPMCLRNLQKLLHGVLIEAEILTSLLPMYLLNLATFLGTSTLHVYVSTPPKWSKHSYVSQNLQKFGAESLNRIWDIDLPSTSCICSTHPRFWMLALCSKVCQDSHIV